jgi:O-antigen/teichoic acid export membrane protein
MALAGTDAYDNRVPLRTRLRSLALKAATVGDQVVVSVTNFVLTLVIGRVFSAEEFAAYGIGLSIGLALQGLQRHTLTIPLMLEPEGRVRRRVTAFSASQLILLVIAMFGAALTLGILSSVETGRFSELVVIASLVCLVVYLQLEFARAYLVKIGRPWLLLASAGWYAFVVGVLSLAALAGRLDYLPMLGALTGAMLIHAAVVLTIAGAPKLRKGARLLAADMRRYGGWSAVAVATYSGYNHVPLFILGAIAAPIHAAAFVATRSLLQPLQILLRGFDVADKSAFARAADEPFSHRAFFFTLKLVALYASVGAVFGIAVFLLADQIIGLAYGPKFSHASAALIAWVPAYMFMSVTMPLESLVYARKAFTGYFVIRGVASLIAIAASIPLIMLYADVGAIAACTLGWFLAVIGTIAFLARGTQAGARS